eukprot:11225456-Lingulodinium_polyedra.AAC.1
MRSHRPFAAAAEGELRVCAVRARARIWRARVERASVRSASRYGEKRSVRPRLCAAFFEGCAKMRSTRPFAAAAARKSR